MSLIMAIIDVKADTIMAGGVLILTVDTGDGTDLIVISTGRGSRDIITDIMGNTVSTGAIENTQDITATSLLIITVDSTATILRTTAIVLGDTDIMATIDTILRFTDITRGITVTTSHTMVTDMGIMVMVSPIAGIVTTILDTDIVADHSDLVLVTSRHSVRDRVIPGTGLDLDVRRLIGWMPIMTERSPRTKF